MCLGGGGGGGGGGEEGVGQGREEGHIWHLIDDCVKRNRTKHNLILFQLQ